MGHVSRGVRRGRWLGMLEFALDFVQWWRPSRSRGVGIRGGFILGLLWAVVSGTASQVGWDPIALTIGLVASAGVGYRLERIGGGLAVGVFSLRVLWVSLSSGWAWAVGGRFGVVLGPGLGGATTRTSHQ